MAVVMVAAVVMVPVVMLVATVAAAAITVQWRAVTAAAMVITAQWRAMTAVTLMGGPPEGVDRDSRREARVAITVTVIDSETMLIATDTRSGTTAATGSTIGALRSATMTTTLTAFITVIGYSGTVFGSGFTVPITTPTTIAGGCAAKPSSPEVPIGGVAITTAWATTNRARCLGATCGLRCSRGNAPLFLY